MITWISHWAEGIIIAVIIGAIIEMILPEGTSKKYIKVVIGIYILFTIISPIITKFSKGEINLDNIINMKEYDQGIKQHDSIAKSLEQNNQDSIKQMYITNLCADVKEKVSAQGYEVLNIEIKIKEDGNYTIESIQLKVVAKEKEEEDEITNTISNVIQPVNEIKISVSSNTSSYNKQEIAKDKALTKKQIDEIKSYLSQTYNINKKNIEIE